MHEQKITPKEVLEILISKDRFTRWLGLHIDEHRAGYCKLHFKVIDDMLNGFDNIHGGVLFSASDSAFAFACNSYGNVTLALDATISFARPAKSGDQLHVEAIEVFLGNKIGIYDIRTTNEEGELIAVFKGTSYRTDKPVS
jgi:acyl-CoA thioesterase